MSTWTHLLRRGGAALSVALILYLAAAYLVAPNYWRHYEHQSGLAAKTFVATTSLGIPGDALNVGLEGSLDEVLCAMKAAGWRPADAITLGSSVKIAGSVLIHRAYPTAPVSPLYWEGRRQDLAFEKPSGVSPSRRHHVRLWLALDKGDNGAPLWLGGATYDRGVGVSHYTGQVTHHIDADIDAERDLLIGDLSGAGRVDALYQVAGVGPTLYARNGGGDRYFTDGEISIARLTPDCVRSAASPERLPTAAEPKARMWLFGALARLWRQIR